MKFKGSYVAIITPFDEKGQIDKKALAKIVQRQNVSGSKGIIVAGTTGEGITLSLQERLEVIKICKDEIDLQKQVIASTGTACTEESVYLTKEAKKFGVDGCLVIVPYYIKPTSEGCFQHFKKIASVGLDMIVYENPTRTGVFLQDVCLSKLQDIPQVKAIKASCGTKEQFVSLLKRTSIPLLVGDDQLTLDGLHLGALGSISVIGNVIPEEWSELHQYALQGSIGKALFIYQKYIKLLEVLGLETNPQMVKYACALLGLCKNAYRLPLIEPERRHKKMLEDTLDQCGILCFDSSRQVF